MDNLKDRCNRDATIRTSFVYPPIPIRTNDWCAWIDGREEEGPRGWGSTKAEAIENLKEYLEWD